MAKLTITRCNLVGPKGSQTIEPSSDTADVFETSINPESFSHDFDINYTGTGTDTEKPLGQASSSPEFTSAEEKVNFSIWIDGTGVVADANGKSVTEQLTKLRDITYDYQGEDHQPNPVELNWGTSLVAFRCRLTELKVDYTLFKPDGEPLRAKTELKFIETKTPKEEAVETKPSSPDLTHVIRVRAGDTLPLLCEQVYKSSEPYLWIARENDLDGFRQLEPGTLLRFPPLERQ